MTAAAILLRLIMAATLLSLARTALADDGRWHVTPVAAPGPVTEVAQTAKAVVAVRVGPRWYRADRCARGVCLSPGSPPPRQRPPEGGLADGWLTRGADPAVARAWYAEPTPRYDHGILGDRVEAGALVVADHRGRRVVARLPVSEVFEDLAPRLADIDGDGRADIVTIRSSLSRGASLAVYGVAPSGLHEIAATPPIGRTHRWLNIAGIADFDGDGRLDVALVETPHIGGILQVWSWRAGRLVRIASRPGYSNHVIGSRSLGLSVVADFDGDSGPELALPDARREVLEIVALRSGRIEARARIALPGRVVHDIGRLDGILLVGLDTGALVTVSR